MCATVVFMYEKSGSGSVVFILHQVLTLNALEYTNVFTSGVG